MKAYHIAKLKFDICSPYSCSFCKPSFLQILEIMFEGLLLRLCVGFVNVQLTCVDLFHGFHKYLAMFICGLDD
jgi:hypothetical protein